MIRITDAVGRSLNLDYNAEHQVIHATDPLSRTWTYAYANGALVSVLDPLLNFTQYVYSFLPAATLLFRIIDARGNIAKELSYENGRVTEQKFPDGGLLSYSYKLSGLLVTEVTVTDSLGRKESKRFNGGGYVVGQADALGQSSRIDRDIATNLATSTTGPCGCSETQKQYDARGNVTTLTDRLGQTSHMEYDAISSRVTRLIDALGRITTFAHDARGNVTGVTDPLGQTTSLTYDAFGDVLSVTDTAGRTQHIEYDNQGNITANVDALGNRSGLAYDAVGRTISSTDAMGRTTSFAYDSVDRVRSTVDSAGATTIFSYDPNGNQVGAIDTLGHTWSASYDGKNRLVSVTDPVGTTRTALYDTVDEVTSVVSPSGKTISYAYDARGRQMSVTDPNQGVVRFVYDSRGSLQAVTDQRGGTNTFSYDALFRLVSIVDQFGRVSSSTYDAVGNATAAVDRLGRTANLTYDPLDRLVQVVYSDATVNYSYDASNKLARIDDTRGGSIQWTYDNANRVLSETTPAGQVGYTYNAASQVTSMTAAALAQVDYAYDTAGRVTTIIQGSDVFSYEYDQLSRIQSLRRPNGANTSYGYDAAGRLSRLTHQKEGMSPIEDFLYGYGTDGQIESVTSVASQTLLPTTKSASAADSANRIEHFGSASITFDALGQTIQKADSQGSNTYHWDARGRLTSVTLPDGRTVSYGYDAVGRRASRTANGTTTSFLYDGADVVTDSTSDGGRVDYVNGLGIDDKLRQSSPQSPGSMFLLQDHLGSTIAVTDADGGVVGRSRYEPYGTLADNPPSRYGYTGRELDADTGLLYYRARWYDPVQGRFLTEDPVGSRSSLNLYGYANQNPVSMRDPEGLQARNQNSRSQYPYGSTENAARSARPPSAPQSAPPYSSPNIVDRGPIGPASVPGAHFQGGRSFSSGGSSYNPAVWEPILKDMLEGFIKNPACVEAFRQAGLDLETAWKRGLVIGGGALLFDEAIPSSQLGISDRDRKGARISIGSSGVEAITSTPDIKTVDGMPRVFLHTNVFAAGPTDAALNNIKRNLAHEMMHVAGAMRDQSVFWGIFGYDDISSWMPSDLYNAMIDKCTCKK